MRFAKKNNKAMKVEGKLIVEQETEPKEVKEVDLHSLSLGKKKNFLPLCIYYHLRISSLLFQSPQVRTSYFRMFSFLRLKEHRFTRNRYEVCPFLGEKKQYLPCQKPRCLCTMVDPIAHLGKNTLRSDSQAVPRPALPHSWPRVLFHTGQV